MPKIVAPRLPKITQLMGRWVAADPWESDVSLITSNRGGKVRVRAVDQSDGQEAEILGLRVTTQEITFSAYWSSGQLTKFRLRKLLDGELEARYTFTSTTTYKKAETGRKSSSNAKA
ncbi:MAG TPA: hypothetical protein VHU23_13985 [Rhizomicrobium sp.]|jgi:hypothetical protein|nr:hypothetical protein [Rhizomicrobium sp.]